MKRSIPSALFLGAAALLASGCFRNWTIPTQQLTQLHGFQEPQNIPLTNESGQSLGFDSATVIDFGRAPDGSERKSRFTSIRVDGPRLVGVTPRGPMEVDLRTVGPFVQGRRYDAGLSAALGISLGVGVTAVAVGILGAVMASAFSGLGGL